MFHLISWRQHLRSPHKNIRTSHLVSVHKQNIKYCERPEYKHMIDTLHTKAGKFTRQKLSNSIESDAIACVDAYKRLLQQKLFAVAADHWTSSRKRKLLLGSDCALFWCSAVEVMQRYFGMFTAQWKSHCCRGCCARNWRCLCSVRLDSSSFLPRTRAKSPVWTLSVNWPPRMRVKRQRLSSPVTNR